MTGCGWLLGSCVLWVALAVMSDMGHEVTRAAWLAPVWGGAVFQLLFIAVWEMNGRNQRRGPA